MKKIFSILAIAAVVALFASCKNNAEATEENVVATDTTEVVVDSTAVAPVADSTAVVAE